MALMIFAGKCCHKLKLFHIYYISGTKVEICVKVLFQNLMKIIIVILCVYIGVRCVSIMTKEEIKDQTGNVINDASDIIVKELVENGDVMKQYMLYIENHKSLSTAAKKKSLTK